MNSTDIPSKIGIPFANAAGGSYIRTVPEASQIGIEDGAASLTDGFPPLTFLAESAGGIPPAGQDFNGIFNLITKWIRWISASGPIKYDSAFATKIGGYPKGAMLLSSVGNYWWLNTVEANSTNPDSGGTNWLQVVPPVPASSLPVVNGTAAAGVAATFSRGDHVHPIDTSRAALSYVNSTFLTITAAAATYATKVNPTTSGTFGHTGSLNVTGNIGGYDLYASRGNSTGVIFLGNTGARYLYYDGSQYILPAANLQINGGLALTVSNLAAQAFGNRSLAAQGWQQIPGGLIMQWGSDYTIRSGEQNVNVTLPVSYPSANFGVFPVILFNSQDTMVVPVRGTVLNNSFQVRLEQTGTTGGLFGGFNWFSVGI